MNAYQKCDSCGKRKRRPSVPWTPEQFVCGMCLWKIAFSGKKEREE